MWTTIYSLDNVKAQVILPSEFKIKIVDAKKKLINTNNFANAGFFTTLANGETYPVGHLVVNGCVISNAKTSPNWINLSKRTLSTLIVYKDNKLEMKCIADISKENNVKYAISGIPILKGGYSAIQYAESEGYFGSEMYDAWHTFLGIRNDKLVLIGAKCGRTQMPYLMEILGMNDSIKLDGGGSFIMHSGDLAKSTFENRRIHNIITW